MSKPSPTSIFRFLHHHYQIQSPTTPNSCYGISHLLSHHPNHTPLPPWLSPSQRTHFSSSTSKILQNLSNQFTPQSNLLSNRRFLGLRYFNFTGSDLGSKIKGNSAKYLVENPTMVVSKLSPLPRWLTLCQRSHSSSSTLKILQNPSNQLSPQPNLLLNRRFLGFRYFNFTGSDSGSKINGNSAKNVGESTKMAVRDAFSRYREAVGLHIEAFWKRNSLVLAGAAGVMVCILLWRVMFGIADTAVGLSEGMAKYGFLALSSAIVVFAGLYLHSRFTINPDKVYRIAMRRLNTNAGILEVMGAPLSGTDLRAYVMSGGGITLKNFKPGFRSKRCFVIFPINGSERKGLVSVEVKKKKGQYDMKLLAVDIPMATGPDQRIFIIGDEEEYRVGGGLINELRDPVVKAMAATKEFEDRDAREDEEDAERELQEAERRRREEVEKLEKGSS